MVFCQQERKVQMKNVNSIVCLKQKKKKKNSPYVQKMNARGYIEVGKGYSNFWW